MSIRNLRFVSVGFLALLYGCGGGGGGADPAPVTPTPTPTLPVTPPTPPDTTPNAISFVDQTGAALASSVTSNEIIISGINANAPISITGGMYAVDSGAFTAAAGSVANNQKITVKLTASSQFSTAASAVLTVGGVSATFSVTTLAADTTPDAFQLQRKANVVRSAWAVSGSATISGINTSTPISIENGEYSINGGAFISAPGTITASQSLVVRAKASSLYSKATLARVTVGTLSVDFEITSELPNYSPDAIVYDDQDTIYLLDVREKEVFRWSISAGRYLDAYVVGVAGVAPSKMTYSGDHQRLYFGYDSGAIRYIDATSNSGAEVPFGNTAIGVGGLVSVGKFVLAQDGSGAWATHYVFDRNGTITDQKDWNYYSSAYAWDALNSRVYFFRDSQSPNDLHFEVIDQVTGKITSAGETPYHGTYGIQPPIRVSMGGQYILLGSGDIYNQAGLTWAGSLGTQVTDARWFDNGSMVTLTTASNQTKLRRLDASNLVTLEQLNYSGQALRIVGSDAKMVVLTINDNTVQFYSYVPNDDSDGDGVPNTQDAFPLDAAASVDTDHDGYPNAWNAGKSQSDSTTGLTLDAFPQDSACYLASHGSGGQCNYGATVPNYVPDQVVNEGNIVYLLSSANKRVYRWSIATGAYLNPYIVGINLGFSTVAPTKMAYSSDHQRLYLGYSTGAIRYIDVTSNSGVEVAFGSNSTSVSGLAAVGKYLLAPPLVFDRNGTVTDSQAGTYYSYYYATEYAWDAVNSRVYFLSDYQSLYYQVVDQVTGKITSTGATPYSGSYNFQPPVRVSVGGQYVLLGSGDIYNQNGLTWAGTLGTQVTDARWFANGSMATLITANNQTTLRRLGANNLVTLEQLNYSGQALRIVGSDAKMVVLAINNNTVQFYSYVPNDDSDGDGVLNTQDAFPLDAAASVDTDHDGYPNAWNAGKSQSDSTTGLTLDAFPQDSACYLASHGSGGQCNYGATIPNYVPDQVVNEGNIVYLLSSANKRVYRWSIATGAYLNPYIVGIDLGFSTVAPTKMAYSSDHQRLYLGYSTGAIRYIDVTSNSGAEVAFGSNATSVSGLAAVGKYLLAPPLVFDRNGVVTDSQAGTYYSYYYATEYAWDAVNSRVYFLSDYQSLYYQVVDQVTGKITSTGAAPYSGSYNVQPPIRVSVDGQYVLLGSGGIYNQSGLAWAGSLGMQITDARWFLNGSKVALITANNQTTLRRLGSNNLVTLEQLSYSGQALRIVGSDAKMAVLVINNNTVQFYTYIPNDDSDGDGVTNTQDAFPLDAAASVDTDHDGYPNAWNAGKSQSDSTTGLTLDAFPQDSACYLASHGSGGQCNYGAAVPNYVPDQVVNEGDIVYLLSGANKRVYRWSIATGAYLNPYVVGLNQGLGTAAPIKMAYSSDHQRLYLGYSTGAIQYIDVTSNSGVEVPFSNSSSAAGGLAAAGKYLLAPPLVFDRNGVVTDSQAGTYYGNYYSSVYTWDAVNSRVYYFRDGLSPNDLLYNVIDQVTGKVTSSGETPYHGSYSIYGPIRVSVDGQSVLLGSGDIYNQADLTWSTSLGKSVKDANWKGNVLVTLDSTDLVEIRDKTTLAVMASYQYLGQPVALVFGQADVYLVHIVNNKTAFLKLAFGDQDQDSMPKWWEQLYGLSDSDASDALTDLDGDGLNNAMEYQNHSNPLIVDTDSDGLNDYQEVVTYATNPAQADSDGDGLNDKDEVVTYHSNPWNVDTDGDGYNDFIEVTYGGNPNDQTVLPTPLMNFTESFESNPTLVGWSTPQQSNANWIIDSAVSHNGSKSLKAGTINSYQHSDTKFRGLFSAGQLSFYSRIDTNYCCDRLDLVVDGVTVLNVYGSGQWNQSSVQISFGVHDIEWRYQKDYSSGQTTQGAWIDDVVFVKQ